MKKRDLDCDSVDSHCHYKKKKRTNKKRSEREGERERERVGTFLDFEDLVETYFQKVETEN